ncbi:MAG: protein kinase domain-containing protein [Longimicrobiaceae bacterium]
MSGILSLLLGRSLCDRYRVDSVIATGGMGAVCRAFDLKLERHVAVKVITAVAPDADEAERLRQRFHREARAAARLRHPNVVTVHDFGTDPAVGIDFLVMELLAGEDLCARMRRAAGPLAVEEAVEILREGGMGLAAGHRAGMVHRDVKPGNIYLVAEPGGWEVKLLDFGIAQLRSDTGGEPAARLTQFGAPHTPRYASPEQLSGSAGLGPASDVFSMALTGLEMLTGAHPGGLNTTGDDKAAARAVRRLLQQRPEVPLRLAAVIRRSLRLDPAMRFPHADAFLQELNDWDASPADVATGGYASILPFRQSGAPAPRPPSPAVDDGTAFAPRPDLDEGTAYAPPPAFPGASIPRPPPAVVPPRTPPAAGQAGAPAPPDATAEKPRRRVRLRPAGWLLIVLLLVALGAAASTLFDRRSGPQPRPRPPDAERVVIPPAEPAGGAQLARDEYGRVTSQGRYDRDDAAYIVVTGSYTPDQMDQARRMLSAARDQGFAAGLANSAVYPQLRDGYVVVAVGPYADRMGADGAVSAVRQLVAADAFVKRVTLRRP